MPPVINPAATIPYELASDIEYAERCMKSFDKWAFRDGHRARRSVHDAVAAYGRVWGKLGDRQPFQLDSCRPYSVQFGLEVKSRLPDNPVVAKASEVAVAIADLEANPLIYSNRMDKELLHRELARKGALEHVVKALGDLVRDGVQKAYICLSPGDWVRMSFWNVVGRVAAVNHARARITIAVHHSNMSRIQTGCCYTSADLVRVTVEKISPPVPPPLCSPGFEWLLRAVDEQRKLDFYYQQKWSGLMEYYKSVQGIAFAVEMMFRCEQTFDLMDSYHTHRHDFPEEYSACFPDWIEGRLRAHYELSGQLHEMNRRTTPRVNPPPWDEPPAVVQAVAGHDRAMVDLLAHYIADQVGRETGAQLRVFGDYTIRIPEDEIEEGVNDFFGPQPRMATLVKQCGRTLTVEFDPDEEMPGLHEVDIADVRA